MVPTRVVQFDVDQVRTRGDIDGHCVGGGAERESVMHLEVEGRVRGSGDVVGGCEDEIVGVDVGA